MCVRVALPMHTVSGRWQFGLLLSLSTALLWGILPLALKTLLGQLDAVSVTAFRFLTAAVVMGLWLRWRGQPLRWQALKDRKVWLLFGIAVLGMIGNYVCYLISIDHISPAGAQTLIQMAPLLLLLGSVLIFKEPFAKAQWLGFAVFVAGMVLFFNQRIAALADNPGFVLGLLWMIVASVTWAGFALAQKALLKTWPSPVIMYLIYIVACVLLLPFSHFSALPRLDGLGWFLLLFACANTLLAYGAFAEALAHWEASRVSATLALTPLITIAAGALLNHLIPGSVVLEPLNGWSYLGALMVVAGSMAAALLRK